MSQVHEFNMEMTCEGCSGAAKRVLGKAVDVDSFDVSLEQQKVFVTSSLSSDAILEILKKTGKPVTYVGLKQ